MTKEVERLREDIETLVTQAQPQDESDDAALGSRRGDALPAERTRREDRLARIASAMRRLEAQARAEADAERKRRAEAEVERRRAGKPRRGKEPNPVDESPSEKAQSNFTDPELHMMPTNNKGWDYCGNAQARVDETCQIIMATITKLRQCQPHDWRITTSWPTRRRGNWPGGTHGVIGDNHLLPRLGRGHWLVAL